MAVPEQHLELAAGDSFRCTTTFCCDCPITFRPDTEWFCILPFKKAISNDNFYSNKLYEIPLRARQFKKGLLLKNRLAKSPFDI